MTEEPLLRRVRVSFVGTAPARDVERASGVSDVEAEGSVLRCLVRGSFQSFLEALRGHEVLGLDSAPACTDRAQSAPKAPPASTGTTRGAA